MKKNLTFILAALLVLLYYHVDLQAAAITLKSGVVINGPLLDMTDDSVTIQDPVTKQPRNIKTVYIRDIVLDPSEKKIGEKQKQKEKEKEAKEKEAKEKAAKEKEAKEKEAKEKEPKEKDIKLRGGSTEPANLLYKLQPELGLFPGIAYPFGKIGKAVKIGFGANVFSDVRVPMNIEAFQIRLGLSVGFLYHTTSRSDVSSTVMMLPIIAYGRFLYNSPIGLRPYLKVGGGITPVMAGATDMDPTVAVTLGLGYINDKIPYLEFFVEAGMMMVFESVRGDFITANIGVAYRFGAPAAAPAIKK